MISAELFFSNLINLVKKRHSKIQTAMTLCSCFTIYRIIDSTILYSNVTDSESDNEHIMKCLFLDIILD